MTRGTCRTLNGAWRKVNPQKMGLRDISGRGPSDDAHCFSARQTPPAVSMDICSLQSISGHFKVLGSPLADPGMPLWRRPPAGMVLIFP